MLSATIPTDVRGSRAWPTNTSGAGHQLGRREVGVAGAFISRLPFGRHDRPRSPDRDRRQHNRHLRWPANRRPLNRYDVLLGAAGGGSSTYTVLG